MDYKFKCPLLGKVIDDGYCLEINMVIGNLIKSIVLDDKIDKEEAKKICRECELNQLR